VRMRWIRNGGVAAVPASLLSRLPRPPSVAIRSRYVVAGCRRAGVAAARRAWPIAVRIPTLCVSWLAMLACLLAYSVIMVVSSGVYSARVAWADRFLVLTPIVVAWRHRSYTIVPLRSTYRAAGDVAASASHYRPAVARCAGIALLAVLLGWLVAHA
jgi:hypothetical protein